METCQRVKPRQARPGTVIPLGERCPHCNGAGKVEQLGVSGPIGAAPCAICCGSGRKGDGRVNPRRRGRLSANI